MFTRCDNCGDFDSLVLERDAIIQSPIDRVGNISTYSRSEILDDYQINCLRCGQRQFALEEKLEEAGDARFEILAIRQDDPDTHSKTLVRASPEHPGRLSDAIYDTARAVCRDVSGLDCLTPANETFGERQILKGEHVSVLVQPARRQV